ncbi:MAG: hypothetical protein AB1Z98_26945 [Nannocystaceae bacterium]
MRSFELRPLLLFALGLGLAACPDDDGDDSGETTAAASTTDATEGTAAEPSTDADTDAPAETTSGGTEEGTDGSSSGGLLLADVEVVVTYEGDATGLLNVVAVTSFPPVGPPLAVASEMDPSYPWTGTLMSLEEGEYFIAAVLDVGEPNPTFPGPEDLQVVTMMPVVIDGPGPFMVELTLTDPE